MNNFSEIKDKQEGASFTEMLNDLDKYDSLPTGIRSRFDVNLRHEYIHPEQAVLSENEKQVLVGWYRSILEDEIKKYERFPDMAEPLEQRNKVLNILSGQSLPDLTTAQQQAALQSLRKHLDHMYNYYSEKHRGKGLAFRLMFYLVGQVLEKS